MKKRSRGRGRGDRRNRRHGGRHRVAAVPGGDPPDAARAGTRQLPVRPCHPGAVDRRRAGIENQAHAAQRQGTAGHRYPARHPDLPLGAIHSAGDEGEDRALLRRGLGSGGDRARREVGLRGAGDVRREGVDEIVLRLLRMDAAAARPDAAGTPCCERLAKPARRSQHRHGRQVCGVRGFLQEPERGAAARRPGAPVEGQHQLDRGRGGGGRRLGAPVGRVRRHPGARRLRQARH